MKPAKSTNSTDLTILKGLGAKSLEKLAHFNIYTTDDLLLHLPFRYQDKTTFANLSNVAVGDEVLLRLTIDNITTVGFGAKSQLICMLSGEDNQKFMWRFFNFSQYQRQSLVRGSIVECFGGVKISTRGLEMFHPEYRVISANQPTLLSKTLTPVYFCREGISQNNMRSWISEALKIYNTNNQNNSDFKTAINLLHNPSKSDDLELILSFKHPMQQRLIVQEFAARKLALLHARKKIKQKNTTALPATNKLIDKLNTGFELTNAQQKVITQIKEDMAGTTPMLRLLQGDVGCGKTVVAVIAALIAVENNKQVAIMTPTAILSKQHNISFIELLAPLGVSIAFLVSSQDAKEKRKNLELINSGADIIIGTHALIQEDVVFRDLGLVIIDEQHKFGVEQRLALSQKSKTPPHLLAMTATPIPRSLMMSAYGQMNISIIDELPSGRKPIETIVVSENKKTALFEKIKQVCSIGQQVYWVCVLIEESENYNAISARSSFELLQERLPHLRIALVHSKIDKEEKENIMQRFKAGEIDVLISTTVIEVGVNVPNANLMIVENAEKLGLASLHQLRGRVGRGALQSLCVLMYGGKLSENAKERLEILRQTGDGFKIAKKDLELRGAGEVLGVHQTGIAHFRIADLVRDEYLLDEANDLAKKYYQKGSDIQNTFVKFWIDDKNQELLTS